jgi:hypothetical protein
MARFNSLKVESSFATGRSIGGAAVRLRDWRGRQCDKVCSFHRRNGKVYLGRRGSLTYLGYYQIDGCAAALAALILLELVQNFCDTLPRMPVPEGRHRACLLLAFENLG